MATTTTSRKAKGRASHKPTKMVFTQVHPDHATDGQPDAMVIYLVMVGRKGRKGRKGLMYVSFGVTDRQQALAYADCQNELGHTVEITALVLHAGDNGGVTGRGIKR